jgi:Zn ribbon nucleic-acid-binding protein
MAAVTLECPKCNAKDGLDEKYFIDLIEGGWKGMIACDVCSSHSTVFDWREKNYGKQYTAKVRFDKIMEDADNMKKLHDEMMRRGEVIFTLDK